MIYDNLHQILGTMDISIKHIFDLIYLFYYIESYIHTYIFEKIFTLS